ncbi:unnamed protein product, partial [Rotaria magnacalcarata]
MYKITQELLQLELIRPYYSPYAAPVLLVAKHDGTWRMVVDYKKSNNITIKDNHPLPNMEQTVQTLGGGYQFFSKFDMKSGFWQIPIEEEDQHKTAFIIPEGLYEWNVLAQGRHNSLADYLSRHPIPREEAIFAEDYGIVQRNKAEPTVRGYVPDEIPPIVGAIVTRSKTKQVQSERNQNSTTTPTDRNKTTLLPIDEEIDQMKEDLSQIITNNSLDIEQLKIEQGTDSTIHQKIAELMIIREGCTTKKKLIYLPSSMINHLLQVYHDDPLNGHFGVQRTYLKIKNRYWWSNMKQSIIQYIQSCLPCQQYNISRKKKPGRLQPIPPSEGSFQLIGMDYCGPFKQTPRGNQYVLCLTDYCTRWVVAVAVPACSAKTTAEALFNAFISKYGVPAVIRSNQGTNFHNQLMNAISKLIGYDHTYSTTYHPQSNGMIERFNATFVSQIAKLQDKENNN